MCVCERESVCFSFSVRRKRSVICLLVSSRPSLEVRVLQIAGEGGTPLYWWYVQPLRVLFSDAKRSL